MNRFEDKVAIITGISKGIGGALTEALLEKGAQVVGWGMTPPQKKNENLTFISCDVRSLPSVQNTWSETLSLLDGKEVNFLINNAGLGYFGNFEDMPQEEFVEIFEVNVYGVFHTCKCVIPAMKAQGSGHIMNISSTGGLEGLAQVAAYCGAKHAVRGISESLFKELRDFGIKVTAVYPGAVETDFFRNSPGIKAHNGMLNPVEVANTLVEVLGTSGNFNLNNIEFRPLQPKPKL